VVIWKNKNREVKTKITKIVHYKSLYDMIKKERLKNVLPDSKIRTIEQGVNEVYRAHPVNYTKEKEEKFGVIAIRLSLN